MKECSHSTRLSRDAHLTYRHWNLDSHKEEPIKSWSSYDGLPRSFSLQPPAHDFSLDCEIEVMEAADGASFRLPSL